MTSPKIVLASNSPRRAEILTNLGFTFSRLSIDFEESFPQDLDKYEVPEFIANKKAEQIRDKQSNHIYITSDTVVILENEILGKPKSVDEAAEMISKLSGKKHAVVSGVCLSTLEKKVSFSCTTWVYFKPLSKIDIDYYVNTFKPLDKAGAYGIQEWIGMVGVEKIEGSYFNVVGLPSSLLWEKIKMFETLIS